ncbi:MAG: 4-hydroxy-3-methylbut-2-enyl diphosphate reductase, partial [Actinomycetota bacterium]
MVTLRKVVLAAPRGYCAGVDRAVEIVERALKIHGPPVYVRKQIVHNIHVVRDLESKGAVFGEEETEVPEKGVVVLSAHGVAPEVYANAQDRHLQVIDATCPLVTKVHLEARRFADDGRTILLIGHEGHEEVVGTSGEAPDHIRLVGDVDEARTVDVPDPTNVSYLSQT